MTDMKMTECGDVQLWIIDGDSWALPVYAQPFKHRKDVYYQVKPAIAINHHQFETLDRRMMEVSITRFDSAWCVPEKDMEEYGEVAPGITPARYVKWEGCEAPGKSTEIVVTKGKTRNEPTNDKFLKYVNSQYALTGSTGELRHIWFILCTEMAKWVYHKQGEIDLGFAKLNALPYRRNWKQVLLSKFPKFMGLISKFKKRPAFLANLALTDFPTEMRRTDLVAVGKEKTIQWSLEITPTESWDKFVEENEASLLKKRGNASYVAYWKGRVDRAEDKSIEIFKSFVQATAVPCGTVRSASRGGGRRLVSLVPSGKVRPVSMDRGSEHVVTESQTTDSQRKDNTPAPVVENEDAPLSEMSVIRFTPPELRGGGNVSRN